MKILVTGATGYIGGRLVPRLAEEGHEVRCLTRKPEKLAGVPWAEQVEVVEGDALEPSTLAGPMSGVDVVYYLVHSIGTGGHFEDTDRRAAQNVAQAAAAAGVTRIVYLGGLVPADDETISAHLSSRAEVGQIFLDSGVPSVVLQAGVIIDSGSASFEMLRYLTERLPVMVTPIWVESRVQPIAVRDVLTYLIGVLGLPEGTNRRFDIAGPDILTYREMMQRYAAAAGLKRRIIFPIRVLTPWLSSQWVNLVTPVPKAIAQPLIGSLRNSVVATEQDITDLVASELLGFDDAVRLALEQSRTGEVATRWSGADWPGAPSDPMPTDPEWSGGTVYRDERSTPVNATVDQLWGAIEGIGGDRGWYSFPLAWAVRGLLDRLAGGVGLRRGRRHPDVTAVGEPIDFWRVEALERGTVLRLRAEMRLPGTAWLEFAIEPDQGEGPVLHQRALFIPRGLAGTLYWWSVWPFHGVVFGSMLRNLAKAAESQPTTPLPDRSGA